MSAASAHEEQDSGVSVNHIDIKAEREYRELDHRDRKKELSSRSSIP